MAKKSLKDRLRDKQKALKTKGNGKVLFQKADEELRVRLLSAGDEEEFIKEVVQFYLGGDIKGVYSPMTYDEPCAIYEKYEELKKSKDPDDKELAKDLSPKKKYMVAVLLCKEKTMTLNPNCCSWLSLNIQRLLTSILMKKSGEI